MSRRSDLWKMLPEEVCGDLGEHPDAGKIVCQQSVNRPARVVTHDPGAPGGREPRGRRLDSYPRYEEGKVRALIIINANDRPAAWSGELDWR